MEQIDLFDENTESIKVFFDKDKEDKEDKEETKEKEETDSDEVKRPTLTGE